MHPVNVIAQLAEDVSMNAAAALSAVAVAAAPDAAAAGEPASGGGPFDFVADFFGVLLQVSSLWLLY